MYRDALARLAASRADALQGREAPSLRLEERWWLEKLQDATIPGMIGDRIPSRLALNDARKCFPRLEYISAREFGLFLRRQGCLPWHTCPRQGSIRGWELPPLSEARRSWELKYGPWEWDNPTITEWGGG